MWRGLKRRPHRESYGSNPTDRWQGLRRERERNGRGEKWSEAGYRLETAFLMGWKWNGERGRKESRLFARY